MIRTIRKILYPFSLLYDLITSIRNFFYDRNWLRSHQFQVPVVAIGNLNVGGTGKTPQVEYLIRLLSGSFKLAVLSRGYGRESKGFVIADDSSRAEDIGDEPMQFHQKFPDITIAVDENRVRGIQNLLKKNPDLNIILLDDAYQHRRVKAGFYILLTAVNDLYVHDLLLPAGNLRESGKQADRANVIVVTKCPQDIGLEAQASIEEKLKPKKNQSLFFSGISYSDVVVGTFSSIEIDKLYLYGIILVTGIANPDPLLEFLNSRSIEYEHMKYGDHHQFSRRDLDQIFNLLEKMDAEQKIILTTEKDYVRSFMEFEEEIFYLPIETKFLGRSEAFDELILRYVRKN